MLPKVVWEMPELGTFNLHASLLPNYRGAAPINWAIINGETKTESPLFIDDKIDTGAMILSSEIDIDSNENAGHLHDPFNSQRDRYKYFRAHERGNVITTIQKDASEIKSAFKLNKENCKIDWTKSALEINNLIRGLSPYPAVVHSFRQTEEWTKDLRC
jgi:methionyl-tRNA formyltransferase